MLGLGIFYKVKVGNLAGSIERSPTAFCRSLPDAGQLRAHRLELTPSLISHEMSFRPGKAVIQLSETVAGSRFYCVG